MYRSTLGWRCRALPGIQVFLTFQTLKNSVLLFFYGIDRAYTTLKDLAVLAGVHLIL